MVLTWACDQFVVFDDVLPEADFATLWTHVQRLAYTPVNLGAPQSPWLLTDGQPMQAAATLAVVDPLAEGMDSRNARHPTGTPLDAFLDKVLGVREELVRWTGDPVSEWAVMTAVPWIYPPGSGLSWHTDGGMYSAAYAYYVHSQWDPHWGGELVLAHESTRQQRELELDPRDGQPVAAVAGRFDRSRLAARIAEPGFGHYVTPRPNRLVVMAGGHAHKIARVDATAGGHVRASIAGFFIRSRSIELVARSSTSTK